MINLKNLLTTEYLFNVYSVLSRSDKLFLLIGAVAIVFAVLFKIAAITAQSPADKQYRQNFFTLFLTLGIWEVVWFGCRYENARFFGSHFLALLGILIALVWFVMVVIKMFKNYGPQKQTWEKEQVKLKYLPK